MKYTKSLYFAWNPLWKWAREHLNNVITISLYFIKNIYYSQVRYWHSFLHNLMFSIFHSYFFYCFLYFLLYFLMLPMIILIVLLHFFIYKNALPSLFELFQRPLCFFKKNRVQKISKVFLYVVWKIFSSEI